MFRRHRRLRNNQAIRDMVSETVLTPKDFIYPIFIVEGNDIKKEIPSMPGNFHWSLDRLHEIVDKVERSGIRGLLLFGIPGFKDEIGTSAFIDDGIIQRAIREIKSISPEMYVITDVCMCEYTSHGHCGVLSDAGVDNDKTLDYLAKIALSHVNSGADMVAPSDMMDGRVWKIRKVLDENGYIQIPIMSYSAKYSSAFYGPFREAADSSPKFGDRKSYQMDYANSNEAMLEIEDDINEGADIIIVKPALSYLDVIRRAKDTFNYPVAAYNVSGEYSMVKAAAEKGYIDEKSVALEILFSIKRAGADIIITYFALDACSWLDEIDRR
ncbi:MAG: porphobilinogen synthase [Bacillota bacterium]